MRNYEQEFIDGLGTWHGENHVPILSKQELLENYANLKIDRVYIRERNNLIPIAEKTANKAFEKRCKSNKAAVRERWNVGWNRTFFGEMDKLWRLKCQSYI